MSSKILGIDLGITSVGWGIIDEKFDIVASGVRLFEEASSDNNTKRRGFRSLRRQLVQWNIDSPTGFATLKDSF